MKMRWLICLGAAAAAPQFAAAELPFNGQSLGTLQGALDFCANFDADSAEKYRQFADLMVQGVEAEALAKLRKSDEYKLAYETTGAELAKASKEDNTETCRGLVPNIL